MTSSNEQRVIQQMWKQMGFGIYCISKLRIAQKLISHKKPFMTSYILFVFLTNDLRKAYKSAYKTKMHKYNSNQLNVTLFFMISIWIEKTFCKGTNTICIYLTYEYKILQGWGTEQLLWLLYQGLICKNSVSMKIWSYLSYLQNSSQQGPSIHYCKAIN